MIVFLGVGGALLLLVDVEEGHKTAREAERAADGGQIADFRLTMCNRKFAIANLQFEIPQRLRQNPIENPIATTG